MSDFQKLIEKEEEYLGIKLGSKERLLVDNLLQDAFVSCMKTHHTLITENEKLKRIVEVYEKANNLYAEYGNDNPDSIYNFETARQAKAEVERIRSET